MAVREVSAKKSHEDLQSLGAKALLVDVRTPLEFRERHATEARSLPLDEISAERLRRAAEGRVVYLICKSGARARKAAEKLEAEGYSGELVLVAGGTDAWAADGLPVQRESGVISLERQVRIGAGLLVATFSLLALVVSPYFAAGSLFVGCGLVFAGITNWCGMGLLLARMPWNRGVSESCKV
jgi:rhodanese-related sulfurtransferase